MFHCAVLSFVTSLGPKQKYVSGFSLKKSGMVGWLNIIFYSNILYLFSNTAYIFPIFPFIFLGFHNKMLKCQGKAWKPETHIYFVLS